MESYTKMKHSYQEVSVMFSEDPDKVDPADFFTLFNRFVNAWKVRLKYFLPNNVRALCTALVVGVCTTGCCKEKEIT